MKKTNLHIKLARALMVLANEKKIQKEMMEELNSLSDCLQNKDILKVLNSISGLAVDQVHSLVKKTFKGHLSDYLVNLLVMLISGRQLPLLVETKNVYQKLYFAAEGIDDVVLTTARKLSAEEQELLSDKFNTGKKKASVRFEVADDLIGGVSVCLNGKLSDHSLKNYLEFLRRGLLQDNLV